MPTPAPEAAPAQPQHAILPGEPGSTVDRRIAGVLPNYRTADSNQPFLPLTNGQKWKIAYKDSLDYPSYFIAGVFASISQGNNTNPAFGQGMEGYSKRYAAGITDQILGNVMTEAFYPTIFREDPRYFRKINGSVKSRLLWAMSRTVITKTNSGRTTFNFAEWVGNGTVAAIGNTYYRDERGLGNTMQRLISQVETDTISQILKEFWPDLKRHFSKRKDALASAAD